jgi:hypothetical protein
MDTIRIDRAQALRNADSRNAPTPAAEVQVTGIRPLEDWELVLAGGGDGGETGPEWD